MNNTLYPNTHHDVMTSFQNRNFNDDPFPFWESEHMFHDDLMRDIADLPFTPFVEQWNNGARDEHNALRVYFDAENRQKFDCVDSVAQAFQRDDTVRLINEFADIDLTGTYLRIEYALDVNGFWLSPHTDIGAKKFTLLAYLICDEGCNLGTDLYDSDKNLAKSAMSTAGNTLFFVPSDRSYHGFEKREFQGTRRSLIINYVGAEWRAREQLAFPDKAVLL